MGHERRFEHTPATSALPPKADIRLRPLTGRQAIRFQIEYAKLLKTAKSADEACDYRGLERSFSMLADNAQWLTDHQGSLIPSV